MANGSKRSIWADVVLLILHHKEFLGRWGVWLALLAFLVLEWLAHSSSVVVERLIHPLFDRFGWHPASTLAMAAEEALLPTLLFVAMVVFLAWIVSRQAGQSVVEPGLARIHRHSGLIASLSPFSIPREKRDDERNRQLLEQIRVTVLSTLGTGAKRRELLLTLLYGTNWGPLAAALEVHNPRVRNVWLICSRQVDDYYPLVTSWIEFLTDGRAKVERISIEDNNSVSEVRLKVQSIYETHVKIAGLRENQVIADMTGGTAAMTAGLILATLDEQRLVQYLNQNARNLIEGGHARPDVREMFQYVATSPNDIARAFISFLEKKTGVDGHDRE